RGQRAERDKGEPEGNIAHADFVEQCVRGAEPRYGRIEIAAGEQTAADREGEEKGYPLFCARFPGIANCIDEPQTERAADIDEDVIVDEYISQSEPRQRRA